MHEVPLVQVTLRAKGGARLDGDLPGLATFTANLLDEGAGTRDASAIAAEAAYLGADLSSGADWDHTYISLSTPRRTLGASLDLMADLTLRPTFKAADISRERDLRFAQIVQQRDQPNGMASLAFNAIVFPTGHPYHRPISGDSAATARLDSLTVRGF
jgi:zinc protease